jgi:Mg2+ and Co2+ transporter CorA
MTTRQAVAENGEQPARGKRRASRAKSASHGERHARGLRAFLYDAAAEDKQVQVSSRLAKDLSKDQLLWIDVDVESKGAVKQVRDLLDLDADDLGHEQRLPVRQQAESFSFTLPSLRSSEQDAELTDLTCVVSERWLVTAHSGQLAFVDAFDEHVRSDSTLGVLDGPGFLASLLEWELNEYFLAIDAVQREIDRIEEGILVEKSSERSLARLVEQRRRVTYLRGGLTPHRYVYSTLAHPSFDVVSGSDAAADFALLSERLEQAVQAAEGARDTIVGGVDLYMSQTAQRTNDVMKVLTVVSVLLLPASLLAGVFGMNMLPKVFLHSWFFIVVLAIMVAVSGSLLALLYRRGWL